MGSGSRMTRSDGFRVQWSTAYRLFLPCNLPSVLLLLLLPAAPWQSTLAAGQLPFDTMEEYQYVDDPAAPPGTIWYNGTYLYLPAPPGTSPPCARGGMTYCLQLPNYPGEVIRRLLIQWQYDLSTVFTSENRDKLISSPPNNVSVSSLPRPMDGSPRFESDDGSPRFESDDGSPRFESDPANRRRGGTSGGQSPLGGGVTSQDGFVVQMGPLGYLYTGPPPPTPPEVSPMGQTGGYSYQAPAEPVQWEYSFSIPRQKRQADGFGGSQLCPTSSQFIMPRAGLNNRGEWRFVVNMGELDQQYTQLVRAERCISDRCSGLCTLPQGTSAVCQQQYVQKKMVGLDPSGSQVYTDLYWIPHCCVCQIR